jgi:F-type H+-transporting ATPase subunit b
MDGIIEAFHLDIKLLMAQIINFTIVLAVLYKFAYQPLLKVMNERTGKIEKGLEDAKKSQEQLEKAEKIRKEKIIEAKKEAKQILEKMQTLAENNKEKTVQKAQEEAQEIIEKAKKTIEAEKEKMIKEVRQEIGELTGLALEKILDEKKDKDFDEKTIEKAIKEVKGSHQ